MIPGNVLKGDPAEFTDFEGISGPGILRDSSPVILSTDREATQIAIMANPLLFNLITTLNRPDQTTTTGPVLTLYHFFPSFTP
jgi:hypothetical protein